MKIISGNFIKRAVNTLAVPTLGAIASISIVSNPATCKNIPAFEKGCQFIHSSQISAPEVKSTFLGGVPGASGGLALTSLGQLASVLFGRRKESLNGLEIASKEKTSSSSYSYKVIKDAPANGLIDRDFSKYIVSSRPNQELDKALQLQFLHYIQLLNPGPAERDTLQGQQINFMRSFQCSAMLRVFNRASEGAKKLIVEDLKTKYELEQNLQNL